MSQVILTDTIKGGLIMGALIYLVFLIFKTVIYLIFKLGFGLVLIYYLGMTILFHDWINKSQLNDTLSLIGLALVFAICVINIVRRVFRFFSASNV